MKIGRWEVRHDGAGWTVGVLRHRERDGRVFDEIRDAKYYSTLVRALQSLPEREAAEIWNACNDIREFRDKIRVALGVILDDIDTALEKRGDALERALLEDADV